MQTIKIGENQYEITPSAGNPLQGTINGENYQMDIVGSHSDLHIISNNKSYRINLVEADYAAKTFTIRVNNQHYELTTKDRFDLLLEELGMEDLASSAVNDLKAPMPGMVLAIHIKAGDAIKKGDTLLVLEAMKMENVLKAPQDAVVKSVHAETGTAVNKNEVLIEFEV